MASRLDFNTLPVEKLWNLYHDIRGLLTSKLEQQKRDLDDRLRTLAQQEMQLASAAAIRESRPERPAKPSSGDARRPYPKVQPLYRNPANPSETWSGRGNKPRWLAAQIEAGRELNEFRIAPSASRRAPKRPPPRGKVR